MATKPIPRFDHFTHRGNGKHTRYGWLRLTPAFSVHLILDIVRALPKGARVLDPFCGTGTTALVCAEEGTACCTTDINPFLLWLAETKCSAFSGREIFESERAAEGIAVSLRNENATPTWTPPLFQIEKWWPAPALEKIGMVRTLIEKHAASRADNSVSLLKVAFCRTMIASANVSFGHQSMSFKKENDQMQLALPGAADSVAANWKEACDSILKAAKTPILARPSFARCDARNLTSKFAPESFDCVITSPPYPNRMSYIRELRPYMYWLGYLDDARQAGELDWQAIGGTWGCATSNLTKWSAPGGVAIPNVDFSRIISSIAQSSDLLARYVTKYFCDMVSHVHELFEVVKPGGVIHYIVGNSKFYDVLLPVEELFASLFVDVGFKNVEIQVIRKRTSKKELFEYVVSGSKTK